MGLLCPKLRCLTARQSNTRTGQTVADIAASIGKRLAADAVAARIDGELADVNVVPSGDVALEIITKKAPEALEILRHSASHVLAAAVLKLFPTGAPGRRPGD